MNKLKIFLLVSSFLAVSCSSHHVKLELKEQEKDANLWLEEIESPQSLDFAKKENEKTLKSLQAESNFNLIKKELTKIAYDKNRVPWAYPMKGKFYNFWQDKKSVRGVWRRTTLNEYKKPHPKWEIILDIDQLAKKESENWVWSGARCLPPEYNLCLVSFSRGGKDAKIVREFDLIKKEFVKDGFLIPEAKSNVTWKDENSLYVATAEGPETVTDSGYPRILKILNRNEKLIDAKKIFEIDKKSQSISAYVDYSASKNYHFISHRFSFYQTETWYINNNEKTLIPMPKDSDFQGVFNEYLLYSLKSDLKLSSQTFKTGSLVALPLTSIKDQSLTQLELILEPTEKTFFQGLSSTKNYLFIEVIDNILGKVFRVNFKGKNNWTLENIELGKNGMTSIDSTQNENDDIIFSYSDFVTPPSSYMGNAGDSVISFTKLKTAPERFNNKDIISEQKYSTSKDGTNIPYFIIHHKNIKYDGNNPTLLYGYGGFEVSEQPYYLGGFGKIWLERGGVYALANIRGGGEFGPSWHQAAVKENHQVVFDDFISVAQDLIKSNVTSPAHLGIQGGSNGGLLVAGTFVQRPDLFNAVICEVPLIDMLRYHTLLAGASWMDDNNKTLLYVGKSSNVRSRLKQHFKIFEGKKREQELKNQVTHVEFVNTYHPLPTSILELSYIKTLRPKYNRANRKTRMRYALVLNPQSDQIGEEIKVSTSVADASTYYRFGSKKGAYFEKAKIYTDAFGINLFDPNFLDQLKLFKRSLGEKNFSEKLAKSYQKRDVDLNNRIIEDLEWSINFEENKLCSITLHKHTPDMQIIKINESSDMRHILLALLKKGRHL